MIKIKLASYFVKNNSKLIPNSKYIIRGKYYRFELLSPRLIRIEYNKDGHFEDRATALVVNRTFPDFTYNSGFVESTINISTDYFDLIYVNEIPLNSQSLKITVKGTNKVWYPGMTNIKNVGSLNYSLDDNKEKLILDNGLYSFDGYAEIDDSNNYAIEGDSFVSREKTTDIYFFAYNR